MTTREIKGIWNSPLKTGHLALSVVAIIFSSFAFTFTQGRNYQNILNRIESGEKNGHVLDSAIREEVRAREQNDREIRQDIRDILLNIKNK